MWLFYIWIIIILPIIHYILRKLTKPKLLVEAPEIYKPFHRQETKDWQLWKFYLGAIFLLPIRLILLYSSMIITAIAMSIVSFGLKRTDPWPKYRYWIFQWVVRIGSRMCAFSFGFIWIKKKIVQYKTYDKDYLVPQNHQEAIIVSNHVSMVDIYFCGYYFTPSFLSKKDIDKKFIVGTLARAQKCIYVDRDSENERNEALHRIHERVEAIQQGKLFPPIYIFPEGTNTNGKYLLPFKKGAFESMCPVKIVALKYHDDGFSYFDQAGAQTLLLGMCRLYHNITIYEFEGLYKPKCNTWEEFAEKTRDILSKCLDAEKSNSGYREYQHYMKEYVW